MMAATTVRKRPIIFSGPMVRAILEGRKTQTRRVVRWKPREKGLNPNFSGLEAGFYHSDLESSGWVLRSRGAGDCWNDRTWPLHCPYGKAGDALWVRETWLELIPEHVVNGKRYVYRADIRKDVEDSERCRKELHYQWRPSIFMPRGACRIMLEVTKSRVERLWDMSHMDWRADFAPDTGQVEKALTTFRGDDYRKEMSEALWDSINAKRGYPWSSNPWVWVIEFKRVNQ
jgi:hypothetical protein